MIKKQDIAAPRTVQDMERRYKFGKTFAETMGLAKEASKAAEKAEETVENLDSEAVFNLLTENGTKGGFFIGNGENGTTEGDIYINAAYIKAGILSGDLIKAGVIQSADGGVMIDMDNGVSSLARGVSAEFESASWDDVLLPEIADFILSEADKMADNTIKDLAIRIPEGILGAAIVTLYKYTDTNGRLKLYARFMWNDGSISHMSAYTYGSGAWSWTSGSPAMAWSSPSAPNEIISNGVGAMSFYDPSGNDANTCVNPPMYLGFEYRTTELWGGKPVYTQMVYLGYLTGTNKAVNVGVDYTKVIDLKVIAYGSGFATVLPMYGGGNIYAYAFMQGTSVAVSIPRDSSTNYAYAVIKYTK